MHLIWWLVPAIAVFWAVGAHNRLVRLRGAALQGFDGLHMALVRQSELLQSAVPPLPAVPEGGEAGDMTDPAALAWRGLRAALAQFNALLVATRTRALDADAIAALSAARAVLAQAWARVQSEGHDLAGAPVPASLAVRWDELVREAGTAIALFDAAVNRYNEGVRGFPAVLLAWLFGFRPARPLGDR